MAAPLGIPSTRVSDAFINRRLLAQIQFDQLELFKVQSQISTGRRIGLPSEDAPAAQRAAALESLLERKAQMQKNLITNDSYLGASDTSIASVSDLLTEIRGLALSVVGTTASDEERAGVAEEVERALHEMLAIGNQVFRGRYLFAGSKTTTRPFELTASGVQYLGDQKTLYSYADVDSLFSSNVTGDFVFGAVSEAVRGSVDLSPVLTENTPLTDLYYGQGITPGSIRIGDGIHSPVTIDISAARTIGDVARLLEANAPAGRAITARVTDTGLTVQLDAAGGGNLTISEVGSGRTARELGIHNTAGVGTNVLTGGDLQPRLTLTTQLSDILGARARAYIPSTGTANDLVFESAENGDALNGVSINYVDHDLLQAGPGLVAGSEFATYSPAATPAVASLRLDGASNDLLLTAVAAGTATNGVSVDIVNGGNLGNAASVTYNAGLKKLTIAIDDTDQTTVDALIAAIDAEGTFTAARDASAEPNPAGGVVLTADAAPNVANTYNTGGDAKTLFVYIDSGATTANQVMAAVNATAEFRARLDVSEENNNGTGAITDSWSDPAAVGVTAGGSGIALDQDSGIQVTNGGQTRAISFAGAQTIEDLLNLIQGTENGVIAQINEEGTGIDIQSIVSGADFTIGENGGTTATELGIRSSTIDTALASLNYDQGVATVSEGDFRIRRIDGVEFDVNLSQGVAASARLGDPATNSGLLISRADPGSDGNDYRVRIVDSGAGGGDRVTLVGAELTFTVDLAAGFTAQEAINLTAATADVAAQFELRLDRSTGAANTGDGNLSATAPVALSGGKSQATTLGDVLDIINNDPRNMAEGNAVVARLAEFGNGIELAQDGPPGNFGLRIERLNFSDAAEDLGLLPAGAALSAPSTTGTIAAATLTLPGPDNDLQFSARGPGELVNGVTIRFLDTGLGPGNETVTYDPVAETLVFDIDQATTTANRIVSLLAGDATASQLFNAEVVMPSTGTGLIADLTATTTFEGGTAERIVGNDTNPLEVAGAFTALSRLADALRANDINAISRAVELLDRSASQVTFARAELGTRMQSLDAMKERLATEDVELRTTLSLEIDVDLAEAISNMTARLASLQASLNVSGQIAQLSLLDYL